MDRRLGRYWVGLVSAAVLMLAGVGCSQPQRPAALYQVSTLQALMQGGYDGVVTFRELSRHGDTGIGTVNGLDGEMIVLDGQAWQVRSDGQVRRVMPLETTPFAAVAPFRAERTVELSQPLDLAGLGKALDEQLASKNLFYMVRIEGRFGTVKTRSVPRQKPPYRLLLEVSKEQSVFELHGVEGTLVALRCPSYAKDINLAGWHMHFLSRDRRSGGHVLDLTMESGIARIAPLHELQMVLPSRGGFVEGDAEQTSQADLKKVEQ